MTRFPDGATYNPEQGPAAPLTPTPRFVERFHLSPILWRTYGIIGGAALPTVLGSLATLTLTAQAMQARNFNEAAASLICGTLGTILVSAFGGWYGYEEIVNRGH